MSRSKNSISPDFYTPVFHSLLQRKRQTNSTLFCDRPTPQSPFCPKQEICLHYVAVFNNSSVLLVEEKQNCVCGRCSSNEWVLSMLLARKTSVQKNHVECIMIYTIDVALRLHVAPLSAKSVHNVRLPALRDAHFERDALNPVLSLFWIRIQTPRQSWYWILYMNAARRDPLS